jgi:hypothetical protein
VSGGTENASIFRHFFDRSFLFRLFFRRWLDEEADIPLDKKEIDTERELKVMIYDR